jgi:hypothetical protein
MGEFKKNPVWQKAKIVELQNRLGLKQSQIYKWNWDMQRKIGEHAKTDHSVSAPEQCWTGEVSMSNEFSQEDGEKNAQSHAEGMDRSENEDSQMVGEEDLHEVQSQAAPESATLCADII